MPRIPIGTILKRAFRLRCPRCGEDKLFCGLMRMNSNCQSCNLKYERGPGYFLGSTYINYALTSVLLTIMYVGMHFGAGISNRVLTGPLVAFCVMFPIFFFRYARSLFLAMDSFFDPSSFHPDQD